MAELKDMIKAYWKLWVQSRMLKRINKGMDDYLRYSRKGRYKVMLLNSLIDSYNEKYEPKLKRLG